MLFLTYPLDKQEIPVYTARIDATYRILGVSDLADYQLFRPDADPHDSRQESRAVIDASPALPTGAWSMPAGWRQGLRMYHT